MKYERDSATPRFLASLSGGSGHCDAGAVSATPLSEAVGERLLCFTAPARRAALRIKVSCFFLRSTGGSGLRQCLCRVTTLFQAESVRCHATACPCRAPCSYLLCATVSFLPWISSPCLLLVFHGPNSGRKIYPLSWY